MKKKQKRVKDEPPEDSPSPKRRKIDLEAEWTKQGRIYAKIEWIKNSLVDMYFINVSTQENKVIYDHFIKILQDLQIILKYATFCMNERFTVEEVTAYQKLQPFTSLSYVVNVIDKLFGHFTFQIDNVRSNRLLSTADKIKEIKKLIRYGFDEKKILGYF
jgi:hypothetical protein